MPKKYIVTTAVDNTRVHKKFWASINQYAEFHGATIKVVAAKYKNPTAPRSKRTKRRESAYDAAVVPFLTQSRENLCPQLVLLGDLPVQPTATNPTSGLEVFVGKSSAIVGHVKRAMTVVPSEHRMPRVIWSTGACTVVKYGKSRAGARAKEHHVLGALVVEVCDDGVYHVRNVTANKDGAFSDLDMYYSPDGVFQNDRALSVVAGDIHVGQEDAASLQGLRNLIGTVNPQHLVLHDTLDMHTRSHHKKSARDRYAGAKLKVEDEVQRACDALDEFQAWGNKDMIVDVIRSNHDCHLERWVEEFIPKEDPVNTPYWHMLSWQQYDHYELTGEWPNLFELEYQRAGDAVNPKVKFLSRDSSLKLAGVEHAFHGDQGINGSRGSIKGYTKLGCKVTIGHSHTPGIMDAVFQVGVTGKLDMGYNSRPSSWLNAHVVLHADGKRQMVIVIDGRFEDR